MTQQREVPAAGGRIDVRRDSSELRRALHGPAAIARQAREDLAASGEAAIPVLTALVDDPAPEVRWEATHALADMHRQAAAPLLVAELIDDDGGVRWLAAEGLVALGQQSLEPLLHALLERSESVWLRDGAHHILRALLRHGQLPAPAIRVLVALEGREPAIGVLQPAAAALKHLSGPAAA